MINRGFRKVSPDDGLGGLVGGRRLTGKGYRQGRYARRRNWGSGSGEPADGQIEGPVRPLTLVPWKRNRGLVASRRSSSTFRVGVVLGWIAMASLAQLWLLVVLDVVARIIGGGESGWSPFIWPATLVALIGTHLFGFLSDNLTESDCEWGSRALVGFWISILIMVPLGIVLSLVGGLFA